jgi:histidinol dehydrogenase
MEIYRWEALDPQTRRRLLLRARADLTEVLPEVKAILEDVRRRGDAAVQDYMRRFDGVDRPPSHWRVSREAMAAAWEELSRRFGRRCAGRPRPSVAFMRRSGSGRSG